MIVIGLTGSIGMGKTTAGNMLRDMGVPVHCSDEAVHELLRQGGAGVQPVLMVFLEAWGKDRKEIDRRKLREILDRDHGKWDELEDVLHPLVIERQQAFLKAQQGQGVRMAALDIPLLFETGAENRVDFTVCVSAPGFVQRHRVLSRSGMEEDYLEFLLSRQMPDAEKRRRADFIVQTGLGLSYTRRQLENVLRRIDRRG